MDTFTDSQLSKHRRIVNPFAGSISAAKQSHLQNNCCLRFVKQYQYSNIFQQNFCLFFTGCPNIDGCSFDNSDCTSLTCKSTDFGQTVFLNIKLNTCEKDVTVTINIKDYSLGVDFTYTFTANEEIPIPGLSFGPLGSANIQVKITREDKHLKLGVSSINNSKSNGHKKNFCFFWGGGR